MKRIPDFIINFTQFEPFNIATQFKLETICKLKIIIVLNAVHHDKFFDMNQSG